MQNKEWNSKMSKICVKNTKSWIQFINNSLTRAKYVFLGDMRLYIVFPECSSDNFLRPATMYNLEILFLVLKDVEA